MLYIKPFTLINNRYSIRYLEESGGQGSVRLAMDTQLETWVAVKISPVDSGASQEGDVYAKLGPQPGFLAVLWSGTQDGVHLLVMDRLLCTLHKFLDFALLKRIRLPAEDIMAAIAFTLSPLRILHEHGFVHCDITPFNIGYKNARPHHPLCLFDLASAVPYVDSDGCHVEWQEVDGRTLYLSSEFSSVNIQLGQTPSRRNDLESLAYTAAYALRYPKPLPWSHLCNLFGADRKIARMKKECSNSELFGAFSCFALLLDYARGLGFTEEPDYDYLIGAFQSALR
ncbi:hypothetical protein HETIRDRAFT_164248 [Heterobasidion irregulare TC 32-1]|uniref:Protein kinase domain-containing protein n=1 Tax=Heterobasidion irregulare (strain TC 32-1) TaxID=747525 RepID=W4JXR5_HETIT|nr:uncharacterized protein HETIRDRAFT_164248 [Heterobasidion irregulare TC 32-1]ETW78264.1 hypothetical protein HETIRDRAFT_164248 [Heterobasidion irregulare TC 32-1]